MKVVWVEVEAARLGGDEERSRKEAALAMLPVVGCDWLVVIRTGWWSR